MHYSARILAFSALALMGCSASSGDPRESVGRTESAIDTRVDSQTNATESGSSGFNPFVTPAFFTSNLLNAANQNTLAFQDTDTFNEAVSANHNTSLLANNALNADRTTPNPQSQPLSQSLLQDSLSDSAVARDVSNAKGAAASASENVLDFQDSDSINESFSAAHNTNLKADNAADLNAANTAATF